MSFDRNTVSKMIAGFPEWLGPVSVKELRQGLRANKFVIPYVAIQVLAIIAVGVEFMNSSVNAGSSSGGGLFGGDADLLTVILWIGIGVVMPLTSIGALQPELSDDRNVELLLLSNLDRWQIVRGKWIVGCLLSGLMLISLIPYMLTRFFIGGVSLPQIAETVLLIVFTNLTITAIAVGVSGFRNYIGRFFLLGVGVGAWSIVMTTAYLTFAENGSGLSVAEWFRPIGLVLFMAAPTLLYTAYGLQLGRARLRLYENPYDPPASGLIIALIIFSPIIVGILTAVTAGIYMVGSFISCVGLSIMALYIDRGPGKEGKELRFAQP